MHSPMLKPVHGLLKSCFEMKKPPPVLPEGRLFAIRMAFLSQGGAGGGFLLPVGVFQKTVIPSVSICWSK